MNPVLSDHKKKGKVLIPPFVATLGPMQEVSWVRLIVPEILWIALLHKAHGDHEAVQIITECTRKARGLFRDENKRKFCFMSEWSEISKEQLIEFASGFGDTVAFRKVQSGIAPLVSWYPQCPLGKIFSTIASAAKEGNLVDIGSVVAELFDREQRLATMAQATVIWTAFDSDSLVVNNDLALARFPEVDQYPNTEISLKIAASIRSTLNVFAGRDLKLGEGKNWSTYFWNRGVELSECCHE